MLPVLSKAETRIGVLKPFELLMETKRSESNASQATIIVSRIYSSQLPDVILAIRHQAVI